MNSKLTTKFFVTWVVMDMYHKPWIYSSDVELDSYPLTKDELIELGRIGLQFEPNCLDSRVIGIVEVKG
jgi:hypothetical protein